MKTRGAASEWGKFAGALVCHQWSSFWANRKAFVAKQSSTSAAFLPRMGRRCDKPEERCEGRCAALLIGHSEGNMCVAGHMHSSQKRTFALVMRSAPDNQMR